MLIIDGTFPAFSSGRKFRKWWYATRIIDGIVDLNARTLKKSCTFDALAHRKPEPNFVLQLDFVNIIFFLLYLPTFEINI